MKPKVRTVDSGTFGDVNEYPCLLILTKEINSLEDSNKGKKGIIRLLSEVNTRCKDLENFLDVKYIIELVYQDTKYRVRSFCLQYDLPYDIRTRADNYVSAKFRNLLRKCKKD